MIEKLKKDELGAGPYKTVANFTFADGKVMEGVLELDDSRLSVVNNYVAPAKKNYKQSGKIKYKDYGDEDEEEEDHAAAEPVKVNKLSILATQIVSFELRRHTFVLTVKDENNNNSDGKQLN